MKIACFLCGAPEPEHWRAGVGWLLLHCERCERSGLAALGGTDTVRLPIVGTPTQPTTDIERAVRRACNEASARSEARRRAQLAHERDAQRRAELEQRVNRELAEFEREVPVPSVVHIDDDERQDNGDADPLGGPGRPE